MIRAQKTFLAITVFLLSSFILSCTFTDNSNYNEQNQETAEDTPQDTTEALPESTMEVFNPSINELKETNIPIVEITTDDESNIDSKDIWKEANLKINGEFCGESDFYTEELQIKGRGNSSWGQPKKSYSLKLSDKEKILGMPKSKRWVLIANYSDKALLRNLYASYLGNNIYKTTWNPSFKSVHLILNGDYKGVYLLGEQIKIDDKRVNIKDITKSDNIEDGGFIIEVNARLDEAFNFTTTKGVPISLKDPDEVSTEIQDNVRKIIQTAEDTLYSDGFDDTENGWRKMIDENSVIDWYIVNEFTKNNDAIFFSSVYIYYNPEDQKLHFGPNWDFDISCGNINYNGCDNPENFWIKNAKWIVRMFEDPQFVNNLNQRWNLTKEELYDSITNWLPSQAATLQVSSNMNFQKWQILGKYVWPNASGYENRTTYQSEVDYMIQWLKCRYDYLDNEFSKIE